MVELRNVTFENIHKILQLKPDKHQQSYVEDVSATIGLAYAGIMEQAPGELCVIYAEDEPAGIILIGKSRVSAQEPAVLKPYEYAYRFIGFFIDIHYQHKGIGKQALQLALDKVEAYPDGKLRPVTLEVKIANTNAIRMYEDFGFYDSGVRYGDDCVFIRLPEEG